MKKAIKINLGGIIFHIDEDAYDALKNYLSDLGNHFGNDEEAKEIVADVESRMAELFQAKLTPLKQVINFSDVADVIKILGKPSDFGGKENDEEPTKKRPFTNQSAPIKKRFYRDVDNSVLGGVAAGLGAYFNIDPVIFRIIFVTLVFIGGATIPIYLILWIALPAARTSAQKLEMRGEDVNVSSIEKTIKDERDDERKPTFGGNFRNFMNEMFNVFGRLVKGCLKVFGVFFGVILTFVGVTLIAVAIGVSFAHPWTISDSNFYINLIPTFFSQFYNPEYFVLFFILIAFIAAIPIIGILYIGLKLIFRFKLNDRYFWLTALAAWIISIVAFVVLAITGVQNVTNESSKTTELQVNTKSATVLYLQKQDMIQDSMECKTFLKTNDGLSYLISKRKQIFGTPSLSIIKSNGDAFLKITKESRGASYENAEQNINHIQYNTSQKDSLLLFNSHFSIANNDKWRVQQLSMVLALPVGTKVFIDSNMKELLDNSDFWPDSYSGNYCIMEENGLKVLDK
jgi:phage shock protein PspC (stress-responsive transcriptional regulator)